MFLGIDIGTSAVKAVLVTACGRIEAQSSAELSIRSPQPGWFEQSPEQWWQAVNQALLPLRQHPQFTQLQALGLSGQMHGAVCLDQSLTPIRPALLWNDGRSQAQADQLNARIPDIGYHAGVPAMAGFTATKLLWMAQHEPHLHAKIRHILLPKDYIRWCLTGDLATDMSDAAGTLWFDQSNRCWDEALCSASATHPSWLPALLEGCQISGHVTSTVAQATGLPEGLPVAAGAGDAAAGAIGIGAVDEGDAFLSLGTSGQLFVATEQFRPAPEGFVHAFAHALPNRWFQMAAMLNGASPLSWWSKQVQKPIDALLADIASHSPDGLGPLFLPYLVGERTPHNNPNARGAFFGLSADTYTAALTHAVLEGVAFSFLDAVNALEKSDVTLCQLGAIGGGARSDYWLQLMADVLQLPIARYRDAAMGPAFGAARLAQLAISTEQDFSRVCQKPSIDKLFTPNTNHRELYQQRYRRFQALYQAIVDCF